MAKGIATNCGTCSAWAGSMHTTLLPVTARRGMVFICVLSLCQPLLIASPCLPAATRVAELALTGRTDTSKRVVFQDEPVPAGLLGSMLTSGGNGSSAGSGKQGSAPMVRLQPGDYVAVEVTGTGGTLQARPLARTTLAEFAAWQTSARREVMPPAVAATAEAQAEAQRVGL